MNDSQRMAHEFASRWPLLWVESATSFAAFALTADGLVLTWAVGCQRILGYSAEEILGQPFAVFHPQPDRDAGRPEARLADARTHGFCEAEGWHVRRGDETFWAQVTITALHDPAGQLAGFGVLVKDESGHKATHDAVIESERRFRLLVNGVTDYAIFMLSPDGYITNWNEGALRIKGYTAEQIIGSHFSRFYTPEDAAIGLPALGLENAKRDGRFESEGWRVRRDGSRFWAHVIIDAIRDGGELIGFAKITRDITERRDANRLLEQTRTELFQAQKMEALGKLTGGVAHDFNNVLQVLRGNLELLENRHGHDVWSRERIGKAVDAVERGAKLASQLLAFGRRQPLQPVVVNLASMIRGMDDLLRRALGETVRIETVVAGGLWNTMVDVHQLESVILNLAINARDAMPEGGKLTLEIGNALLDDEYVSAFSDVRAGQYVMLAVTDTGSGMTEDVMQHAFDPFFTTKPEGQGTGLGLSMAYGFVKQSGGHIRIYSEPGEGTTVRVYLPRSTEAAVEPAAKASGGLQHGDETILVVEDDPKVRSTVVDMLSALGYKVLKAGDAPQALAILGSGMHIDLVFTDVVMPGPIKSTEMARQAVAMFPDLKVLFTSGYTQNAIVHEGRLDPGVELLSKPYSREQLARRIRQLLGPGREPPANGGETAGNGEPREPAERRRILVVEDENDALDAAHELLVMLDYEPAKASNPLTALEALGVQSFDVLVTDVELPDMSGIELAQRALALRPGIRIVLASGHPLESGAEGIGFEYVALRKPYSVQDLAAAIEAACVDRR